MKLIDQIIKITKCFIKGDITASVFETKYIELWREARDSKELSKINEETDNALDKFFTIVDAYCSDIELRDEYDLDDKQLLDEAESFLITIVKK